MASVSIVIVNYNVKYFLDRCISSILSSKTKADFEIIIIDNASKDDSEKYIHDRYGYKVRYRFNEENVGFARANNQGFELANGDYILALNPDTIIAEDTLEKCIQHLESNPSIGALGVRMIDGSGYFLKESKRGVPTIWNSFSKFIGLERLLPESQIFAGYSLGYKKENEVADVDVLCGAFMMMRREVIQKTKGFDEDYFMYGEDIDLSVKIKNLGYRICYFPETTIIHFKGESSKRSSISYTRNFYSAMLIYVKKHKKGISAFGTRLFIKCSILLIGLLSFIRNNIARAMRIFIDGVLMYGLFHFMRKWWGLAIFNKADYFNNAASNYNSVGAVFIWIGTTWFLGHYDKPWKHSRLISGVFVGTIIILTIYSLLPFDLRSSRAMILLGMLPMYFVSFITHSLKESFIRLSNKKFDFPYFLMAKKGAEINKLFQLLSIKSKLPESTKDNSETIVIDSNSYTNKEIIQQLNSQLKGYNVAISGVKQDYVLHSISGKKEGSLITPFSYMNLGISYNLRLKRIMDIIMCFFIFFTHIFKTSKNKEIIENNIAVLLGYKTWVGYEDIDTLPRIKKSVFNTNVLIKDESIFPILTNQDISDKYYAKNYSIFLDYKIITQNLKHESSTKSDR
jgi:O-antigen biosynthesis protein